MSVPLNCISTPSILIQLPKSVFFLTYLLSINIYYNKNNNKMLILQWNTIPLPEYVILVLIQYHLFTSFKQALLRILNAAAILANSINIRFLSFAYINYFILIKAFSFDLSYYLYLWYLLSIFCIIILMSSFHFLIHTILSDFVTTFGKSKIRS